MIAIQRHLLLVCWACAGMAAVASAQAPERPAPTPEIAPGPQEIQHLYIPAEKLGEVFGPQHLASMMSLKDFQALVNRARAAQVDSGVNNRDPELVSTHYQLKPDREMLQADVVVELAAGRPGEITLNVTGWNVLSARLDDQPAPLARAAEDGNSLRLFVSNAGKHELRLQLSAPLKRNGNDQHAAIGLIPAPSGVVRVELPADRFLVWNNTSLGHPGDVTQPATCELPSGGLTQAELILSDRQRSSRPDVLTFASTAFGVRVSPSEITWTAQTELQVFGEAIDRLVCRVPQTLEITKVESPGLESWELMDEADHPGRVTITLKYRQPFEGNRSIFFQGILSESPDQPWQVPDLTIMDVTAHSGMILIGHPANVRLQLLDAQGVRTTATPPAASGMTDLGADLIAFQVWKEAFTLKFAATLKQQQVEGAVTALLQAREEDLAFSLVASLQTRQTPLFDARLKLPAQVDVLSAARDGNSAAWDDVSSEAGVKEIRIPLTPPLLPGQSTTITLETRIRPDVWPVRETAIVIPLPTVGLPQVDMVEVLYGILAPAELEIVPLELQGFDPAGQGDLQSLARRLPAGTPNVRLAFTSQETAFQGQLQFRRQPTLFTSQSLTFFRVDRETVFSRIEAQLSLAGGGIRDLQVQLSQSAGERLRFSLIPLSATGTQPAQLIEQIPGAVVDDHRLWTLKFDRYLRGEYLLVTEVQLPRGDAQQFSPPHLQFPQANAQSGYLAIEGASDEQVHIVAQNDTGAPLAAVDPVDLPPSQYHPQERIIAGFRFLQNGWTLNVTTTQFQRQQIPSAVIHEANLVSVWSPGSPFQHQADYRFTAVGMQNLLITVPTEATLWSTVLDGQAIEARSGGEGIRIPLAGIADSTQHTLQIVYNTPVEPRQQHGELRAVPPRIQAITGDGSQIELPILQQRWQLHYPQETILLESDGQFLPEHPLWSGTLWARLFRNFKLPTLDQLGLRLALLALLAGAIWGLTLFVRAVARNDMTVFSWVVLFAALIVLVMLILPATQQSREAARRGPYPREMISQSENLPANAAAESSMKQLDDVAAKWNEVKQKRQPESGELGGDKDAALAEKSQMAPQAPPAAAPSPRLEGTVVPFGNQTENSAPAGIVAGSDRVSDSVSGVAARAAEARSPFGTGGLLSMNVTLEIPQFSRVKRFQYDGNGSTAEPTDLRVEYANRTSGRLLILSLALGTLLLGWWLRRGPRLLQGLFLLLALVLPLTLLGVSPLLWDLALQGVLFGGLMTLLAWVLVRCRWNLGCEHSPLLRWVRARLPVACLLLTLACCTSASAEDKPAPPPPPPPQPFVVIPYESLEKLSAAEQVWIPAALYKQLWTAAHPEDVPAADPSLAAFVADVRAAVKLLPDQSEQPVQVQFRWVVINTTQQAQPVMLPLESTNVRNPLLDGAPALVQPAAIPNRLEVVITEPGTHVVDVTLVLADKVAPNRGEMTLPLLPVGAGSLVLELPTVSDKLTLRVNQVSGDYGRSVQEATTRFQIPIDRGGRLQLRWQDSSTPPLADQNRQLETTITADVEDAGIRLQQSYLLRVRNSSVNELNFEIPPELALQQVSGPDVSSWELVAGPGHKELRIVFTRPITKQTEFSIDLFQSHALLETRQSLEIQTLIPVGIARETGLLGVSSADSLRMRVLDAAGLQQIDLNQFQPATVPAGHSLQLAFRFIDRPIRLPLEIERRDSEGRASSEHGVQIARRRTLIASRMVLNLTGAPRRMLEVQLPAGYVTMDVVCEFASDWYVVPGKEHQRLILELDQPRTGAIEIGLEGHLSKSPQQETLTIPLPIPIGVDRSSAQLGIWCDETYQATLLTLGNWRSIPSPELAARIRALQPASPLFAFQTSEPASPLEFQLRRATPELQGDAGVLIAVGDATVDYGITLRWTIANAAADQFVFTTPAWLGHLELTGQGIRQVESAAIEGERTRWTISLIDPVRSQYLITAAATIAAPADLTVKTPQIEFETQTATGAFLPFMTQRHFAVLVNLSRSQLSPVDLEQFESVSVDQLPLAMPSELVQQAMDIVRVRPQKVPSWKVQQMERAVGSQAIIPSSTLTTVLQMDGSWRTQALLGVRNRGQQFLALRLPENSQLLSVFVRGAPGRTVRSELNGSPVHLIALPQTSAADLSFDVAVLLSGRLDKPLPEHAGWWPQHITLPAVEVIPPRDSADFGITVAQTVWNVFVPDEVRAVPVLDPQMTNVVFHKGAGWVAAQAQMLDRLRSDIAEMKRIATGSFSSSQRLQARNNLRQLQSQLQTQPVPESAAGAMPNSYYLRDFAQARTETEQALQELDLLAAESQSRAAPDQQGKESLGVGNRAYISKNNESLLGINSINPKPAASESAAQDFNFYRQQDAVRERSAGKKAEEVQDARVQLRRQLQSQSFDANVAQPVVRQNIDRFLPQRASEKGIGVDTFGGMNFRLPEDEFRRSKSSDGIAADRPVSGRNGAEQEAESRPRTDFGLSVAMAIPETGRELSFDKAGGNPTLTLAVRSNSTWPLVVGSVWSVVCLALGIWWLWLWTTSQPTLPAIKAISLMALLLGAVAVLLLTGPWAIAGIALFGAAAIVRMWRPPAV